MEIPDETSDSRFVVAKVRALGAVGISTDVSDYSLRAKTLRRQNRGLSLHAKIHPKHPSGPPLYQKGRKPSLEGFFASICSDLVRDNRHRKIPQPFWDKGLTSPRNSYQHVSDGRRIAGAAIRHLMPDNPINTMPFRQLPATDATRSQALASEGDLLLWADCVIKGDTRRVANFSEPAMAMPWAGEVVTALTAYNTELTRQTAAKDSLESEQADVN